MEMAESCVPPGFRFHPTDEELVGYYLKKKVASQKIDLDVIRDIDLYRIEPWDLQETCRIGYEEQNEWYFFSHKDKKYPTGTRTNRATLAGFWKATGRDKAVYDKLKLIGMRKTLVFYKGRAPSGKKSNWIMHEYRLESEENAPPHEEGWVVCRAFKKRTITQAKVNESSWDPPYLYNEPSGTVPTVDREYFTSQAQNPFLSRNIICKQEIELAKNSNLNMMSSDQFVQLPQLESPSISLMKRATSSVSLVSGNNEENSEIMRENFNNNKLTDWRALDKFVASQLSHDHDVIYENHPNEKSDVGLLLLENGVDNNNIFKEFLSSSFECDTGICIFDK